MAGDLTDEIGRVAEILDKRGFVCLDGALTLALLGEGAYATWSSFARSWGKLGEDLYMADGGRYRRRRHAAFVSDQGHVERKPHQPHYQSRDYNPLNGDVQRWFEPVLDDTAQHPVSRAIFDLCSSVISRADRTALDGPWHIEFHQFRIETKPDHVGRPTPEGLHRDGVDWVFVMLVRRENVRDGVTQIGSAEGEELGSFTLQNSGDAVLLDDRRILHGVTEIHALNASAPAYRDVLVVTFAR